MMYNPRNWLACFLLSILLTACGGGSGEPTTTGKDPGDTPQTVDELKSSIRQLDLTGAQGFVITGSNTSDGNAAIRYKEGTVKNRSTVNMDPNSLYKVSVNGTLERVAVRNEDSQEIDRGLVQPFGLMEVDANYLFMWFRIQSAIAEDPLNSHEPVPYLVHKVTGLAYRAEDVIWQSVVSCGNGDFDCKALDKQYKKIRADNQGNIYVGHNDTVYKIDTSNLGGAAITAQPVQTRYAIHSSQWEVDATGSHLLFNGRDSDDSEVDIHVNLSDGRLTRIGQVMSSVHASYNTMRQVYLGLDGRVYFVGFSSGSGLDAKLFQASQDQSGNLELTVRGNANLQDTYLWGNHHRQVINGKLIYYNGNIEANGNSYMGNIIEFDDVNGVFTIHTMPTSQFQFGNESIKSVTVSNGYMFFLGTDKNTTADTVYRYDPATKTGQLFPTDVSSPINDFDIGNIKVLGNNKIWFDAFRLSDSTSIIGEMDMDASSIEIIDTVEATEPAIIVMEAIHPADFIVVDGSYQDWATELRTNTDNNADGSPGHELTFFSYQQTPSQLFGLVEFNEDRFETENAGTTVTIDGSYDIAIHQNDAYITDLATGDETTFLDAGALTTTGQAVEFSVPLSALSGIGFTPVVTVQRYALEDITASDTYEIPDHAVTIALPRALETGDKVIIELADSFELEITPSATMLVNTSSSIETDLSSATSGLNTTTIAVTVIDAMIGSPNSTLSPVSQRQLGIEQDEM